jgi:transposase-like protein
MSRSLRLRKGHEVAIRNALHATSCQGVLGFWLAASASFALAQHRATVRLPPIPARALRTPRTLREAEQPGVSVAEVCRKHGIAPSLIYDWRAFGRTLQRARSSSADHHHHAVIAVVIATMCDSILAMPYRLRPNTFMAAKRGLVVRPGAVNASTRPWMLCICSRPRRAVRCTTPTRACRPC